MPIHFGRSVDHVVRCLLKQRARRHFPRAAGRLSPCHNWRFLVRRYFISPDGLRRLTANFLCRWSQTRTSLRPSAICFASKVLSQLVRRTEGLFDFEELDFLRMGELVASLVTRGQCRWHWWRNIACYLCKTASRALFRDQSRH